VLALSDGISTKRGSLAAGLLHGLPIIATRGERVDSTFVHGENVYLVPVGDEHALSCALRELAASPELRARLARGARLLHERVFHWDVIARQVASVASVAS
jgi:glycosyltransferase involved in cell wall biosynthesis